MFRSTIIIGWKASAAAPELIYLGRDGAEAAKEAAGACASGEFVRIIRLTNAPGTPLPVHPAGTVVSKTVPNVKPEPFQASIKPKAKAKATPPPAKPQAPQQTPPAELSTE